MRYIPADLQTHLESNITTLTTCLKIERQDGAIIGFTEHDRDLVIEDITYQCNSGLKTSAIHTRLLGQSSIEAAFLETDVLKRADLLGGLWDQAKYTFFMVNYQDLYQGHLLLKSGYFGKMQLNDGQFFVELHDVTELLNRQIGQVYSPYCRVEFGSPKCGIERENYAVSGKVTDLPEVLEMQTYRILDQGRREEDDYFNGGVLTWLSGTNRGLQTKIKKYKKPQKYKKALGELTFFLPQPGKISISDEYRLTPGCSKAFSMCRDRYHNVQNFRGEPFIPGWINGRKK